VCIILPAKAHAKPRAIQLEAEAVATEVDCVRLLKQVVEKAER